MSDKYARKEPAPIKTYTKIELARLYEVSVATLGKEIALLRIKGMSVSYWKKRNRIYPRFVRLIFNNESGLGHPEIDVDE